MRFPRHGSKVRIPKGTKIWGTFPEHTKVAGRTYTVAIKAVDRGYPETPSYPGREDEVVWAGAGGYWHYAKLADVEVVS
jgi:hypothetical protein